MRRTLAFLALIALPLHAGETRTSEATTSGGGGSAGGVNNGGVALTANTVPKATGANTLANSTITDDATTVTANTRSTFKATLTGGATTNNFFNVTGTVNATNTANAYGVSFNITGAGSSAFEQSAFAPILSAGYTGSSTTTAVRAVNLSASTGSVAIGTIGGNMGAFIAAAASASGTNTGSYNLGSGATTANYGSIGIGDGGTTNIGLIGTAGGSGSPTSRIGGFFGTGTLPTLFSATLMADNAAVAQPILSLRDNSAALPTTGATATFTVLDGALPQLGNGVLTSATMTAETQANERTSTHSYTWTNAQVVALGAALVGDITVATLPAKTQVVDALVVITGAASGPTTLTVSCGDAVGGTPFINYVVASDAKAAANTVYGDASAERGTAIDTEWYYVPSYASTTLVTCHFIATVANLNTVTGSTGRVILTTRLLP